MREAGYELAGTALKSRATGQPFGFEIMVTTKDQERFGLAFAQNLRRAGIAARIRQIEPALLQAVQVVDVGASAGIRAAARFYRGRPDRRGDRELFDSRRQAAAAEGHGPGARP